MNAILLAGGKSRRFGSDKALIPVNGKPLIQLLCERLCSIFDTVYVSIANGDDYSFLPEVQFIHDRQQNQGPLGGLHSALLQSDHTFNFLCGCDMPNLSVDFLRYLQQRKRDYDVLVPLNDPYYEPLAAVYSKNCIPAIEKLLGLNNFKLIDFYPSINLSVLSAAELERFGCRQNLFYNINSLNDYNAFSDKA